MPSGKVVTHNDIRYSIAEYEAVKDEHGQVLEMPYVTIRALEWFPIIEEKYSESLQRYYIEFPTELMPDMKCSVDTVMSYARLMGGGSISMPKKILYVQLSPHTLRRRVWSWSEDENNPDYTMLFI